MEDKTSVIFLRTTLKDERDLDLFIQKMLFLFSLDEGRHYSVNPDDKYAMSLGILQWHGVRARQLLSRIIDKDEQSAKDILAGTHLFDDTVYGDDYWQYRTAADDEIAPLQELLASPYGRQAQNELAKNDIVTYLIHGVSLGITDIKALAFFCDLENQAGGAAAEKIIRGMDAGVKKSLDTVCRASLADQLMGVVRRDRRLYVYHWIKKIFKDLN